MIGVENIGTILWSLINLALFIFIAILLYKVLSRILNSKSEQEIINKLDQLIELNQQILEKYDQTRNDKSNS